MARFLRLRARDGTALISAGATGSFSSGEELVSRGFRLLQPFDVAEGVWAAFKSEGTGEAWIVQPGREPLVYEFKGVPGPR